VRSGLFVTGTGTGVGKTAVAAALLAKWPGAGYWKPVQTGVESDDDAATVRTLVPGARIWERGERLPGAFSPDRSARLAGRELTAEGLAALAPAGPGWVVEGAGGVLVPLNARETIADLMVRLRLPVLVAAHSGLGTINHTLLTLEALRARGLNPVGVVLVGTPDADNRAAIERFGGVPVVGEMPRFERLAAAELGAWARRDLDPLGRLEEFLKGAPG